MTGGNSTAARSLSPSGYARSLAADHPDVPLPCWLCLASVHGENLERHIEKAHGTPHRAAAPGAGSGRRVAWWGADHRVRRWLAVLLFAAANGVGYVLSDEPAPFTGADIGLFVVAGVLLVLMILGAASVLPARLGVEGDSVVLRYGLGLGHRRLGLAGAALAVGSRFTVRPKAMLSSYADDMPANWGNEKVPAGCYLRIGGRWRAIVVGCRHHTGIRKHWTGWQLAKPRRRCDIVLSAGEFVELQYALAAQGALHLPARDGGR